MACASIFRHQGITPGPCWLLLVLVKAFLRFPAHAPVENKPNGDVRCRKYDSLYLKILEKNKTVLQVNAW